MPCEGQIHKARKANALLYAVVLIGVAVKITAVGSTALGICRKPVLATEPNKKLSA